MIIEVERVADPRLEAYRHVGDHQWLRSRGLFVAEGRLVVERLIAAHSYHIHSVLATPAALAALGPALGAVEAPVYLAAQSRLDEVTGFNFHRGCVALAVRPGPLALDALLGSPLLLGLQAIGNPDNVGGLFRTAAAFGVGGVLLDAATGDPFYRKAIRTSMGASLTLPFAGVTDWPAAIARLRARGFVVAALTPKPAATGLDDVAAAIEPSRSLLVMVGAEGDGLSPDVLDAADTMVRIPTARNVDSLNVTVAAGVALARLARLV